MKCVLVLLALVSLVFSQTEECPNPVECEVNPCQDAICPRFLNARCEPDVCNGECRAVFRHIKDNSVIDIDNCEVETCADRECPSRRTCVEEVFPANCPLDQPICRQYLRPVCELPAKPRPPSDCSVVQCDRGMTCELYQRASGPEARCVPFKPQTCEELGPCDRRMECRHRARGNGLTPVVRCVPIFTHVPRPRDCSELECEKGFSCGLFGAEGRQRARCVRERNLIKSCEELNCEAGGMVCDDSSRRPVCRSPRNCDEVTCASDQVCSLLNVSDIPLEFRCPFRMDRCKVYIINKLDGGRILACRDQSLTLQSCDGRECPDDKVCVEKSIVSLDIHLSICLPKTLISAVPQITTCDITPEGFCSQENNLSCVHLNQNGFSGFAHCTEINCQEGSCSEEEDSCVVSSERLFSESGIPTSCAPRRVGLVQDNACDVNLAGMCNSDLTCTDTFIDNTFVGAICIPPFTLPPLNCEELSCAQEELCVRDIVGKQAVRASCENADFLRRLLVSLSEEL